MPNDGLKKERIDQVNNTTNNFPQTKEKQRYKVYAIIEKPGEQKNFWLDIGLARTNKDDSITCKLDVLPISGVIQLRIMENKKSQNGSNWPRRGANE
jgi:hypothetical protein